MLMMKKCSFLNTYDFGAFGTVSSGLIFVVVNRQRHYHAAIIVATSTTNMVWTLEFAAFAAFDIHAPSKRIMGPARATFRTRNFLSWNRHFRSRLCLIKAVALRSPITCLSEGAHCSNLDA
jgi:hypothetical protein